MADKKNSELEENFLAKDFIKLPKVLNKKYTQEEFHQLMTLHNSDIPIRDVNFLDYPDIN